MQALLSFDQAPPIAAPFRFFLTAPLFGALAALLMLAAGPDIFLSRWTPSALAATHLIALGFVLQVMLGAMIQILPVVAGANLRHPLPVARVVHFALLLGVLALAAGFISGAAWAYEAAIGLLGAGIGFFVLMAAHSLYGVPATSPTISGLKLALAGLSGVVSLGVLLAAARSGLFPLVATLYSKELVSVHVGWGFGAWGLGLLAAVSYVVVPMFQMTPNYPQWFSRLFGPCLLAMVLLSSLCELGGFRLLADLCEVVLVWLAACFCIMTLWLQSRSKRARLDSTQRLWRAGIMFAAAGCTLWALAHVLPALDAWAAWPMVFAVLVLLGGFTSVIVGMLYKIVPFLVWLHLQNRGRGRITAPNMKMVLGDRQMDRQRKAHVLACLFSLGAVIWPQGLLYPAAALLLLANGLLALNLLSALGVYRRQAAAIDAQLAERGAA